MFEGRKIWHFFSKSLQELVTLFRPHPSNYTLNQHDGSGKISRHVIELFSTLSLKSFRVEILFWIITAFCAFSSAARTFSVFYSLFRCERKQLVEDFLWKENKCFSCYEAVLNEINMLLASDVTLKSLGKISKFSYETELTKMIDTHQ